MIYFYIAGSVLLNVLGQLVIKSRVIIHGPIPETIISKIGYFKIVLLDPLIWLGVSLAFLQAFFWIAALSKSELSIVGPIITALYMLFTLTASIIIFGESSSIIKLAGILMIVIGIIFLILANHRI